MYKINSASLWRSKYEMKGRNNITVMLSILEEEYVKKVFDLKKYFYVGLKYNTFLIFGGLVFNSFCLDSNTLMGNFCSFEQIHLIL